MKRHFIKPGPTSVPPVFQNDGGYATSTSSTTFTPALPTGRANGDILIGMFESGNNRTFSLSGSGWTQIGTPIPAAPNTGFMCAWRRVDGTEGSPTWSSAVGTDGAAVVLRYSGCKASGSPIGATNEQSATANLSISITTTAANSLVITIAGSRQIVAFGTPTGYTVDSSRSGASVTAMQAAHKTVAASGTVTSTDQGNGGANEVDGFLIELLAA